MVREEGRLIVARGKLWFCTCNTWATVEGSVGVDAHRVLDAAAVVGLALVDVVADLPLAAGKV